MRLVTIFERLGFDRHAHRVYNALLKSREPMLIAHIASKVGVSRTQVYRSLERLLKEGFVSRTAKGKRAAYRAESPSRVETRFLDVAEDVRKVTDAHVRRREKDVPEYIRFLKGFSGIREVFDDVISHTPKGATFYRYTSERDLASVNRYLSSEYRRERDRKKLERLVISNPISARQKRPRLERFIKYMEPKNGLFDQNVIEIIYGDRIAFIDLTKEQALIVENKPMADFQKIIFEQLYRKL
jgi:sugar-specific transcriptional regulator TrmB